tara:strand:+ start:125 stop:1441 length:1317 start_codon:yes stop_codon:yes gene_type:complete
MKIIISESQFNFLCENGGGILTEQRRPLQSLKRAFTAGLKTIDPKILTNYLNFKITNFNDLSKHIDEFAGVWKQLIPASVDLVKVNSFIKSLDYMAKRGKLKNVEIEDFIKALVDIPTEGGMRETVVELFDESRLGKVREIKPYKIEVEKVGDEVIITTIKGNEVKQYKKHKNTNFLPITKELDNSVIEDSLNILYKYGNPNERGWIEFGSKVEWPNHSGWKFHIFGSTLEDSAFLIERLTPVSKKYGAHGKVGGLEQVNHVKMKPGTPQHGKQGATIYIPKSVIDKNQQGAMLSDIKSAIQGYNNKGGNIMGDKMITPQIHYRNELIGAPPNGGFRDWEHYNQYYNKNSGGSYKPNDVEDLFSNNKVTKTIPINYLSTKFGDTSEIDWSKIVNAKSVEEYDIFINDAIKSNNYNMISRGGFENYGIYNFREYLKNNH